MADYFTMFSVRLQGLSDEEKEWARSELKSREDYYSENEYTFSKNTDNNHDLYIYTEDYGNPETAAHFFQEFLKKFRPKGCIWLTWAETCSKPRADSFTGGAVFITAEGLEWFHCDDWIGERRKEFEGHSSPGPS